MVKHQFCSDRHHPIRSAWRLKRFTGTGASPCFLVTPLPPRLNEVLPGKIASMRIHGMLMRIIATRREANPAKAWRSATGPWGLRWTRCWDLGRWRCGEGPWFSDSPSEMNLGLAMNKANENVQTLGDPSKHLQLGCQLPSWPKKSCQSFEALNSRRQPLFASAFIAGQASHSYASSICRGE